MKHPNQGLLWLLGSVLVIISIIAIAYIMNSDQRRINAMKTQIINGSLNPNMLVDVQLKSGDYAQQPLLIWAINQNHKDLVELLIDHGADVNVLDYHGGTALEAAIHKDDLALVKLLIDHGANVLIHYPIFTAVSLDRMPIVQLLLDHGADINAPNDHGQTPLMRAVMNGNYTMVEFLVEDGANNASKETALLWARKFAQSLAEYSPTDGIFSDEWRSNAYERAIQEKNGDIQSFMYRMGKNTALWTQRVDDNNRIIVLLEKHILVQK